MKIGRKDIAFESSFVIYFEGAENYTYIHFYAKKRQLYARTLLKIEKQLTSGFVRIHRKYLINTKYIKSFDENTVTLSNNIVLPVSRRKKKNLQ